MTSNQLQEPSPVGGQADEAAVHKRAQSAGETTQVPQLSTEASMPAPQDAPPAESIERRVLKHFGYFGFFLHRHAGGRAGKPYILTVLRQAGGSLPQRELLAKAGTAAASLSEVLTKLENEKLIERKSMERDARQREVILTAKGQARAAEIDAERKAFMERSLSPLTDEEKTQLVDMLDRLSVHWHDIEDQERATNGN